MKIGSTQNSLNLTGLTSNQINLLQNYIGINENYTYSVTQNDSSVSGNNVLQIKVPIIADVRENAVSCIDSITKAKPAITGDEEFQIIGFIDMNIFDVSYEDTISFPTQSITMSNSYFTPLINDENLPGDNHYDYLNRYRVVNNPEDLSDEIKMPHITLGSNGPFPGHFHIRSITDDKGTTERSDDLISYTEQNCQLVRARAACGTHTIASSNNSGAKKAIPFHPLAEYDDSEISN